MKICVTISVNNEKYGNDSISSDKTVSVTVPGVLGDQSDKEDGDPKKEFYISLIEFLETSFSEQLKIAINEYAEKATTSGNPLDEE